MGAYFQSKIVEAKDEAELVEKFREVKARAQYMSGHGGYTGTFAEKPGLEIKFHGEVTDSKDADEHARDGNPKWGPAWAYNIGDGRWLVAGYCSS